MPAKQKTIKTNAAALMTAQEVQHRLKISQPSLSRMVQAGELIKLGHGWYAFPDVDIPPEELDFAVACARFGSKSAVGGLSALFHYGLTDQPPSQIWMIVPPNKRDRNRLYRSLRTKTSFQHGIDQRDHYRITNVERTIIEGLKFSIKFGPRVAINAARKALAQGLTTEKKLGEMARALNLRSVLEKYWEAIVL